MEKKMNNKGFSLVELIIVIAIMVILVAVLAPQYLRYVEKSRVSSDTQTIVEFINAMQVAAADEDSKLDSSKEYSVKSAANADGITVSGELKTVLGTTLGLMDAASLDNTKFQSEAYKAANCDLQLKYNSTRKVWEVIEGTGSDVAVSGKIK